VVSTPKPPDPAKTAQAQAGYNQDTATQQQLLNQTDQITNDGTLKYTQTGTNTYTNANGKTVTVPKFTATQQLSASNQGIYDTNQATKQNIATIGKDQSARIGALLGNPLKLGNEATEARLYELGSKRLNPQFAQQEDALRTRLINSGVREGSAAYDAAYNNFSQGKNDAYNQLLLNGRAQANTELQAERNAPINEISALMSGSQIAAPNYASTPQTQVGGVDYTGLVNDQYKAKLAASQSSMGGLFGLAAAPFGMFSF
jgi:hypothetical protein